MMRCMTVTSSVEWQGKYIYKLLAVDVPAGGGQEQRLYLEGDDKLYNRGSVMRELRDPFLNVCAPPSPPNPPTP